MLAGIGDLTFGPSDHDPRFIPFIEGQLLGDSPAPVWLPVRSARALLSRKARWQAEEKPKIASLFVIL